MFGRESVPIERDLFFFFFPRALQAQLLIGHKTLLALVIEGKQSAPKTFVNAFPFRFLLT